MLQQKQQEKYENEVVNNASEPQLSDDVGYESERSMKGEINVWKEIYDKCVNVIC